MWIDRYTKKYRSNSKWRSLYKTSLPKRNPTEYIHICKTNNS